MAEVSLTRGGRLIQAEAEREKLLRIIAHLNNEITGLKRAYASDIELVNNHKSQLNSAEDEIDRLKQTVIDWKNKFDQVNVTVIAQQAEIEKLNQHVANVNHQLVENNSKLTNHNSIVNRLSVDNSELKTRLNGKHNELESIHSNHDLLSREFNDLSLSHDEQSRRLEALNKAIFHKNNQIAQFIKERRRYQEALGVKQRQEKLNAQHKHRNKLNDEEGDNDEASGSETEEEREVKELNDSVHSEHHDRPRSVGESPSKIANYPAYLDENLDYNAEEAKYYRTTIHRQVKHIQLLEQKQMELQSCIKLLQKDNHTLTIRYKGATELRLQYDRRVKGLQNEITELHQQLSAISVQNHKISKQERMSKPFWGQRQS
jgi:chromosome segregation ATPase